MGAAAVTLVEINFDGIVGPSHNYAGLSPGNLAATRHLGQPSHPRAAALQGIAKMRANIALGLTQGILLPAPRPDHLWLAALATRYADAPPHLQAQAISASAMWAANAATVSPAPDTADGRCHLTVANLSTMPHRSHEARSTLAQLRLAFSDAAFTVHEPVPATFGDEGAANHMRLAGAHAEPGVEVFVYGERGGGFPARQHRSASEAIARAHGLDPDRTLFALQSEQAIATGAFHNDVVAVANGPVLLAHERAFADKEALYDALARLVPDFRLIEVTEAEVPLADAIRSYLFNAQLVTLADGGMALVVPGEARDDPRTWRWCERLVAGNGPIRRIEVVDVRESMANGGGPACLRLRVVAEPRRVDPRFLVDPARLDVIERVIERFWPARIDAAAIGDPVLVEEVEHARAALLDALDLAQLDAG